jgi:hypothetical protein
MMLGGFVAAADRRFRTVPQRAAASGEATPTDTVATPTPVAAA